MTIDNHPFQTANEHKPAAVPVFQIALDEVDRVLDVANWPCPLAAKLADDTWLAATRSAAAKVLYTARPGSPRARAAERIQAVFEHKARLLRFREALRSAPVAFERDTAVNQEALKKQQDAVLQGRADLVEAEGEQAGLVDRIARLQAEPRRQFADAAAAVTRAEAALASAVAAGDEVGDKKAAAELIKARAAVRAADAAQIAGVQAEVVAALEPRVRRAEQQVSEARNRLAAAESKRRDLEEEALQIEVDRALAGALDVIVKASLAQYREEIVEPRDDRRSETFAADLQLKGANVDRVPLLGVGLANLLAILYRPDFAQLDVDLSMLSDGNEPPPARESLYYDDKVGNQVAFYEEPRRNTAKVTYTDPS